jgi:preprotein translocase subunit SecE
MARTEGATAPRRPAARKAEERGGSPKPAPVVQTPSKSAPAKPKANVAETATRRSVIALRTESVRKLYRETASEMKKINWPDQQTTKSLTILVIGISVVLGILLGGIDYLLLKLLQVL